MSVIGTTSIELVADPDVILAETAQPVATADSGVLERCAVWVNLAREVVDALVPQARLIDLANVAAAR